MFIHDPDGLFKGRDNLGGASRLYGVVAHMITTADSFVPPAGANPDESKLEGQVNRLTPALRHADGLLPPVQYRQKFVKATAEGAYGSSGARLFRSAKVISIDHDRLLGDLKDPKKYGLKEQDERLTWIQQMAVAHELGHRFTLGHRLTSVSVGRTIRTTDQPLDLAHGEFAAIQVEEGKLAVLKVRIWTEERELPAHVAKPRRPGELRRFYSPLMFPLDLLFKTAGKVTMAGGDPHYVLPNSVSQHLELGLLTVDPPPPKDSPPTQPLWVERTVHWFLKDALSDDQEKEVQAGNAKLRMFCWSSQQGPNPRGTDWMDEHAGSYWAPARSVPAWRITSEQMKLPRSVDFWREDD